MGGRKRRRQGDEKYLCEENRYPENIALYRMCGDIWADGEVGPDAVPSRCAAEMAAQWRASGVEVIPLRTRTATIDLTVGYRDHRTCSVTVESDEAIATVAPRMLEEQNYVRKHTRPLDGKEDKES